MRNSPYGITVPLRASATINKFRILRATRAVALARVDNNQGDRSMRQRRNIWPSGLAAVVVMVVGAGMTVGLAYETTLHHASRPPSEKYALASVCWTDLYPALTASGQVESSTRTVIECELENITIGVLGERLWAGGSSVLLSIVPEGS